METNIIIKTTDGEVKYYLNADYHIGHNGLVTVDKEDRTIDTYHMANVYYIREEKKDV